ncbi:MAG TPA: NAD(P)H-dependent glycerol-3-phosphate dehydrogenase [Candidatus Dormibacteraeota bacterium]|nr:NAD(P)H-dependent glycerol-3-phosphate dehydrogenase [Candidatus Dormibacteraeota bacterium]
MGDSSGPAAVAVIGAGAWGTTLAALVARRESVSLVCRTPEAARRIASTRRNEARLPGVELPASVRPTAEPAALDGAELVIVAVPSAHVRSTMAAFGPHVGARADVLSVVKGLERATLLRMSEVIAEAAALDASRVAALSGPNLAPEIARGLPASAVVAATVGSVAARVADRLARRRFRLYVNSDLLGVELAGALKNVVAIAAGAAEALGFGDNGKAGLMTRGLAEMMRLGIAMGANPLTFAGLAGIGDIVATCGSPLSRNHRLGVELAAGRPWSEIESTLPGVAEGAYTVDAAIGLARRHGVEMPIAEEVHAALFEGKSARRCLVDLLARERRDELPDLGPWLERLSAAGPSPVPAGVRGGTGW